MRTSRKAKTHFVPKAVYRTAFVGVVPVCVAAAACSGSSGGTTNPAPAVACAGFACAVGVQAFADSGDAPQQFSVAAIGFEAGHDASPSGDAASTPDSQILAVACLGFCGVGVAAFGDGGDSG